MNISVIISVEQESESEGEDAPNLSSDNEDLHDLFDYVDVDLPVDNVSNNDDHEHHMSDLSSSCSVQQEAEAVVCFFRL